MVTVDVDKELDTLSTHYTRARERLEQPDLLETPAPGKWSSAQHLYHLTKTNSSIAKLISGLTSGSFGTVTDEVRTERLQDLEKGYFPRGGSSPPNLEPPPDVSKEDVEAGLVKSWEKLEALRGRTLDSQRRFAHGFYGPLNAAEWLRFAQLHTEHHLKLIAEVG